MRFFGSFRATSWNVSAIALAAGLGISISWFTDLPYAQSNDPASGAYQSITDSMIRFREECSRNYAGGTRSEKDSLIALCRQRLFETLTEKIFPAWYGTRWGFYGTSRLPGKGEIACGYFVVFTLQDVGFRMSNKMADQPSENIIKNLVDEKDIARYPNGAPMEKVLEWIEKRGGGLYIVGLDCHVGFIINNNGAITFCHSNYYDPPLCVVNQKTIEKSPLTDSRYRIIGRILQKDMIEKWIKKEAFPIRFDYFRRKENRFHGDGR